uniref:Uncharacterized protein n=1 Tax=viral metagenome TaxID=1070528 RepID=A0A6C0LLU4_9ZZZZ
MLVADLIENFEIDFVYYLQPVRNNIMENSKFTRLVYSNEHCSLNSIYLILDIKGEIVCDKYYNKFKYSFNIKSNSYLIDSLTKIEKDILKQVSIQKEMKCSLQQQFSSGSIKLLDVLSTGGDILLKISGIWETDTDYGLTYKFISCRSVVNHPLYNNSKLHK